MKGLPSADKNFGQHFLVNENTIRQITTLPESFDTILEVGPGPGVLTNHLPKDHLFLLEKDKRFRETLEKLVVAERVYLEDALHFDYKKIPGNNIWLVSNLPYNVSAPLTVLFLQNENIKTMTLMYQKEVASKILARDDMNSLAALCQNFFEVKSLVKVSPGSFFPPPKVQSEVLTFRRKLNHKISLSDFFTFETFLRNLYKEKRKTLFNNLKKAYEPEKLKIILSALKISESIRAEKLSFQEIEQLYLALKKI